MSLPLFLSLCYKELAHMIRAAGMSHHLPSASWRPRKAGGVVPVQI